MDNLLDVYSKYDLEFVKARGFNVWDKEGNKYLDFYGGHAVISIGHQHPVWVDAIKNQLEKIAYYSNAMQNAVQAEFAKKLAEFSNYPYYRFFACNSGAEANENALKAASFYTQNPKIIAFEKAFHGRTSGAVAVSDYPQNISPFNAGHQVIFAPWNNTQKTIELIEKEKPAAVIIEGIQGVGGINIPEQNFIEAIRETCTKNKILLILDEVQSGYGRTGKFFAHQHFNIQADIITMAKGMGNGFPVGGMLINPTIEIKKGQLGTTFGGAQLAMAAANAVLKVLKEEKLIENAAQTGQYLLNRLKDLKNTKEIRSLGLMTAIDYDFAISEKRKKWLFENHLVTGSAGNQCVRLLPPLSVKPNEIDQMIEILKQ